MVLLIILLLVPLTTDAMTFVVGTNQDFKTDSCPCRTGDTGNCTLRGAILAANETPGVDSITLPANTYILSDNSLGQLSVTDFVTINGDLSPTGQAVDDPTIIKLSGTIKRAFTNSSSLTLRNVFLLDGRSSNPPDLQGGCIFNSGTLTIDGSYITHCGNIQPQACFDSPFHTGCDPSGGGLGKGGAIYNTGLVNFINGSQTYVNTSNWGADIYNDHSGIIVARDSEFNGSHSLGLDENSSGFGDTAGGGGCIFNFGTATFTRVSGNYCRARLGLGGGFILNGSDGCLQNCSAENVGCPHPGVACVVGGNVTLINSTLTDNRARRTEGGAIKSYGGTINITFTTIAHTQSYGNSGIILKGGAVLNSSYSVIGYHNMSEPGSSSVYQLCCTLPGFGVLEDGGFSHCNGTVNVLGLSYDEACNPGANCAAPDLGCPGFTDFPNLCLGANQLNSPPPAVFYDLDTVALLTSCSVNPPNCGLDGCNESPAINAGPPNCGLTVDNRGAPRMPGNNCDLGAFEAK